MDADNTMKPYAADDPDAEQKASDRESAHSDEVHPGADDVVFDLVDVVEEPAEHIPPRVDEPEALKEEEPAETPPPWDDQPEALKAEEPAETAPPWDDQPETVEVEEPAEPTPPRDVLPEALEQEIIRIAEKVAREMFPDIAERVIREEIEKLKEKL